MNIEHADGSQTWEKCCKWDIMVSILIIQIIDFICSQIGCGGVEFVLKRQRSTVMI